MTMIPPWTRHHMMHDDDNHVVDLSLQQRIFLVMEYCPTKLEAYVASPAFTTLEFYRLSLELCDVLTFLHRRNVAHRDLKPVGSTLMRMTIMLMPDDDDDHHADDDDDDDDDDDGDDDDVIVMMMMMMMMMMMTMTTMMMHAGRLGAAESRCASRAGKDIMVVSPAPVHP
jgi:hypothetical protein